MIRAHEIDLGEYRSSVERRGKILDVRDQVTVRICDAIKGTIVATRAPITRGLGNHVEW